MPPHCLPHCRSNRGSIGLYVLLVTMLRTLGNMVVGHRGKKIFGVIRCKTFHCGTCSALPDCGGNDYSIDKHSAKVVTLLLTDLHEPSAIHNMWRKALQSSQMWAPQLYVNTTICDAMVGKHEEMLRCLLGLSHSTNFPNTEDFLDVFLRDSAECRRQCVSRFDAALGFPLLPRQLQIFTHWRRPVMLADR